MARLYAVLVFKIADLSEFIIFSNLKISTDIVIVVNVMHGRLNEAVSK